VQVAGIDSELDPVASADPAARVNPRRPQRLAFVKRDRRSLLFLLWGKGREILVLDRRRVDGEDHVDIAAECLGHVGHDRHPGPRVVGQARVLEIGRPGSEDHVPAGVRLEARTGAHHFRGDGQPVSGERDRHAVVAADHLGLDDIHRR
jgi:hypothetical protein